MSAACSDKPAEPSREAPEIDIYLAGMEKGTLQATVKVWKNGTSQTLHSTDHTLMEVVDMVVHNDVAYVAASDPGGQGAYYWQDGNQVQLTSQFGARVWATGIAVHGNDVYVSGYVEASNRDRRVAVYWKNGTEYPLANEHPDYQSYAHAITVINGEVHIAGETEFRACIWKNGIATPLEEVAQGSSIPYLHIRNFFVSGHDVYVYVSLQDPYVLGRIMAYWKNGEVHYPLEIKLMNHVTWDFFVKGNDIYIAGSAGYSAVTGEYSAPSPAAYWKNGEMVLLGPQTQHGAAYAIAVTDDNDIYTAGYEGSRAALWINGQKQSISVGNNSMFQAMVIVE